jgi:putative endonuclease
MPGPFFLRRICVNGLVGRQLSAMGTRQITAALLERGIAGLDWIARRRNAPELPLHLQTGLAGEDAAFFELRRKGYTVVARRWSAGNLPGDLDLIAWHGSILCFVEVKTRTAHDMSPAESAVDRHKQHVLRRLARAYLRQLPQAEAPPVRFDVMSVYLVPGEKRKIVHFENAFGWSS